MADEQGVQDPRALLQEVVKDADDDQLTTLAENLGGVQGFLELTFEGMKAALDSTRAQNVVIGWQIIHGDDVHPYRVVVEDGALSWSRGEADGARVTLRLKLPNYMRLIAGQLDGMQAFMSGALQVMGDVMFATQIQDMFGVGTAAGP
jgi:putative sterol carrier protein